MYYRKTKIVATIGLTSSTETEITAMMKAGMNVARLNFSHGDYETHAHYFNTIRRVSEKLKQPVAILQDLSGPKIRIGDFSSGIIELKEGTPFILTTAKILGDVTRVYVNYKNLPKEVSRGNILRLDDGKIELLVEKVRGKEILCRVTFGGIILGRRGVNAPGTHLSISAISARDKKDIEFGISLGVDFMALSFVQSARDVIALRKILTKHNSKADIIAKIETESAVQNIDGIIAASDGIMIARGDLAVEIPQETVPIVQKTIIKKCISAGKPVITATQMLESMIKSSVPTRAEVNDVANAVLDGTDAVMLSAETAVGIHPVLAIKTMDRIARTIEQTPLYQEEVAYFTRVPHGVADSVSESVVMTAREVDAKMIIAHSEGGLTPRMLSRYKPRQPILVLTPREITCRQLTVSFGCYPFVVKPAKDLTSAIALAKKEARRTHSLKRGETFVMVAGIPFRKSGSTNLMLVERM